ncbi:transposase [Streptomyces incanus]|uniref:Transposase n=1 Tax=Streptomyces incanus TaxID=887453 RepID=A0ABW0XSK2_9ACTN
MRDQDAWLVFEDESGQSLRPPKARTWSRRGRSPRVEVSGKGSGRISPAAPVCARPGRRARLIHRMPVHHSGRCGEKKGFRERDFAALLDAARRQPGGEVVLVRDDSTQHKDVQTRQLPAKREKRLTAFRLPACTPESNPAEMGLSQCEPCRDAAA